MAGIDGQGSSELTDRSVKVSWSPEKPGQPKIHANRRILRRYLKRPFVWASCLFESLEVEECISQSNIRLGISGTGSDRILIEGQGLFESFDLPEEFTSLHLCVVVAWILSCLLDDGHDVTVASLLTLNLRVGTVSRSVHGLLWDIAPV